ncbi:MAG TPA: hypothetical protein VHF50_07320 [Solirubrobacterales bacterium]|nr:hypothetical protein [Solirubrobacterales bacterium]
MSSRRLISLLAALTLATGLTACGEGGGAGGGDPAQTIDSATLEGIESGALELSLAVDVSGKGGGDFDFSLSGPFQAGAKGDLPQLDLDASAQGSAGGERLDFEGGLVLLPSTAYVNYEGTEYEVDPTTLSFAESVINPGGGGRSGAPAGCEEAVGKLPVSRFVDNLSGGEAADVEGTDTTRVSGDLDVPGALDALLDLAEDPACQSQLATAGELPSRARVEAAQEEIEAGLKSARIDVYIGDDDIVRRIAAELEIEPRQRSAGGPQRASIDFELSLAGVNEEQEITAPANAKPLGDLFLKLGINPIELLGLLEGEALPELLEGIGSAATGGGSGPASQQEYLECLGEARTPVDLEKCTRLAG